MRWMIFFVSLTACLAMGGGKRNSERQDNASKASFAEVNIPKLPRHKISPYIFGFGTYMERDREKDDTYRFGPTVYRWGGNTSERFNYKTNSWNTGADWFFMNVPSAYPNLVDFFMEQNRRKGVASSVTIPTMGMVAKDGSSKSFPKEKYPSQEKFDKDAGNGKTPDGKNIVTDSALTSVAIDSEFVSEWVSKLKNQFGDQPHFYHIGNEPMLWGHTHRDAHPNQTTYDEALEKFLNTAIAVRKADPAAVILGPALWGWLAYHYSAFDLKGEWNNFQENTDRKKHGDIPFLEWFVREVKKKEDELKLTLLDGIDIHFYSEARDLYEGDLSSDAKRQKRLEVTRSLWDKTYTDPTWINDRIYLIPRMKELIAKTKPNLKLAIGEYNFYGEKDISGAIAQGEALGIFAQEDLYFATLWTDPPKDSLTGYAFSMYRNYDGKGSKFGDSLLPNTHGIKDDGSVFSSWDEVRKVMTVMVINKTTKTAQSFKLNPDPAFGKPKTVMGYRYGGDQLSGIATVSSLLSENIQIVTQPMSMTLIEIKY